MPGKTESSEDVTHVTEPSGSATYRAYILRAWQERPGSPDHPAVWRYSLEDTRTRRRRGFASLNDLTAHLHMHASAADQRAEKPDTPKG